MKILFLLILGGTLSAEAKPTKKAAVVSTKVEKFTELRLRGNLKRPELNYDFEDENKPSERKLATPENFDEALLNDLENR